jgi:hypothetical protein
VISALAQQPASAADEVTAALLAAITPEFASTIGWDPEQRLIVFPQNHPTLGWKVCEISGCTKARTSATGLCATCHHRWISRGRPDLEGFKTEPKGYQRAVGVQRCVVPRCERPWKSRASQLCLAHDVQRRDLGVGLEEFVAHPAVAPHCSLGRAGSRPAPGTGPAAAATA